MTRTLKNILLMLGLLTAMGLHAQETERDEVNIIIKRNANGVTIIRDTTIIIERDEDIDEILENFEVFQEEGEPNQRVIIREIRTPELDTPRSGKPMMGVYLMERDEVGDESPVRNLPHGAYVIEIIKGGAAEAAGLNRGDVIMFIGEEKVENVDDVTRLKDQYNAGDVVKMKIWRNGEEKTTELTFKGATDKSFNWTMSLPQTQKRTYIGLVPEDLSRDVATALGLSVGDGVYVIEVVAEQPAEKAGLRAGDVIMSIDGVPMNSAAEFRETIAKHKTGDVINVAYRRVAQNLTSQVTLGETATDPLSPAVAPRWTERRPPMPPPPGAPQIHVAPPDLRGLNRSLRQIDAMANGSLVEEKRAFLGVMINDKNGQDGVLISGLSEDGPAEKAGMRKGDILVQISGEPIEKYDDLTRALKYRQPGDQVDIRLIRDGKKMTVRVKLGEKTVKVWKPAEPKE